MLKLTILTLSLTLAVADSGRQRRFLVADDNYGLKLDGPPGSVPGLFDWDVGSGKLVVEAKNKNLIYEAINALVDMTSFNEDYHLFLIPAREYRMTLKLEPTAEALQYKNLAESLTKLCDALLVAYYEKSIRPIKWAVTDDDDDLGDVVEENLKITGAALSRVNELVKSTKLIADDLDVVDFERLKQIQYVLSLLDKLAIKVDTWTDGIRKVIKALGIESS